MKSVKQIAFRSLKILTGKSESINRKRQWPNEKWQKHKQWTTKHSW